MKVASKSFFLATWSAVLRVGLFSEGGAARAEADTGIRRERDEGVPLDVRPAARRRITAKKPPAPRPGFPLFRPAEEGREDLPVTAELPDQEASPSVDSNQEQEPPRPEEEEVDGSSAVEVDPNANVPEQPAPEVGAAQPVRRRLRKKTTPQRARTDTEGAHPVNPRRIRIRGKTTMNVSEGHPYFNESYNFPPRAGAVAVPEQDGDGDVEEGNRAHEQGQGLEDNISSSRDRRPGTPRRPRKTNKTPSRKPPSASLKRKEAAAQRRAPRSPATKAKPKLHQKATARPKTKRKSPVAARGTQWAATGRAPAGKVAQPDRVGAVRKLPQQPRSNNKPKAKNKSKAKRNTRPNRVGVEDAGHEDEEVAESPATSSTRTPGTSEEYSDGDGADDEIAQGGPPARKRHRTASWPRAGMGSGKAPGTKSKAKAKVAPKGKGKAKVFAPEASPDEDGDDNHDEDGSAAAEDRDGEDVHDGHVDSGAETEDEQEARRRMPTRRVGPMKSKSKAKVQGKAEAKATATAKAKAAGTRPEEVVDENISPAEADSDSICPDDSASQLGYRRPSPIEEDKDRVDVDEQEVAPPHPKSKATSKANSKTKTSKATARPKAKATSTPSDHLDSLEEEDHVDVGDDDEDEAPPPKTKGKAKAKAKAKARAPAPPEGGDDEEEVDDFGDQEPQAQHPLVPPQGHQNFVTQWRKLLMERAGLSPDDAYASPRDLGEQRRRENLMRDAGSFGVDLGLKSYQARIVFGLKERILKRILVNHQAGSGKTKLMIAYLDEAAKMAEKERRATRESLRNTHHRKIVFDKSRQMENFELQLLQNPSDLRAALFNAQTREDTLLRLISSQFCRADQPAECTQRCGDDLLRVGDLGARAGRDATFEAVKKRLSDRANSNNSGNSWANAQWKLRNGCKIDAKKEAGADDDAPAASYVQIQKMLRRSSMGVHKTHVYQSARAAMSHASGINWDQLKNSVARPSAKGRRAGDRVTFIVDEAHLFVDSPNNKADNAQIAAARKQFLTALREKPLMQHQESVQVALMTATPEKELLAVLLNCRYPGRLTKTGCVRMDGTTHAGLTGLVSTYADGGENDTARPLFYSPAANEADERSGPKAKAGDPEAWLRRQGKRSPVSKAAAELDFLSAEGRDLVPGAKSTTKSKVQFSYKRERRGGVDGRRLKFSVVEVTVPNETRALYYMKQREGMSPGSLARLLGTKDGRRKKIGRGSNDGRAFEPLPGTEYLRNEAVAPKFNVFARHLARRLQEERSNFVKSVRAIGPAANGGSGCTSVERLKEIAENRLRFLVLVDTDAAADALSRVLNVVLKSQLQGAGRTTAAGAKGKAKAKAKALATRRGSTSNSKPQHLPVYRLKMTKSAQDAALAEGGWRGDAGARLKGEDRRQALQDIGVLMEAKQFDNMKFGVLLGRAKEVGTGTDFQKLREVHVLDIPRARDLVQYFGRGTRLNAHQDLTLRERDEKCVADWLMTTTGGDEAVVAASSSAGGDAAAAAEGAVAAAFRWQNVEANVRNFLYVSRFSTTTGTGVAGRSRSSAGAPRRRRSARSQNAINPRNHAGGAADAEPDAQGNRQEEELQLKGEQLLFQLFLRASLPTNMKITEKDGMEKKTAKGFQEAGMLMQAWGAVGRGWGWAVGVGATKKELASRVVEIARNPRSAVAAREAAKRIIDSVARDVSNARTHADIGKAFFDAAAGLPTYKAAAKLNAAVKGTIKKALGLDKLREAFNEQAAGNGAAGGKARKAVLSMLSLKTQDEVLRDQMFETDFVSMGSEERDFYRGPSIEGANLTKAEVTNFEAQLQRQKLAAGGRPGGNRSKRRGQGPPRGPANKRRAASTSAGRGGRA